MHLCDLLVDVGGAALRGSGLPQVVPRRADQVGAVLLLLSGVMIGIVLTMCMQAVCTSAARSHSARGHVAAIRPKASVRAGVATGSVSAPRAGSGMEVMVPAPIEQCTADSERSVSGPTNSGGWQCLTFLALPGASEGIIRYGESGASSRPKRMLVLRGVSEARWTALTRCATMATWQAAVTRLVAEAASEERVSELM